MYLNYRVVRSDNNYRIVEVLYESDGKLNIWAEADSISLNYDSYEELKRETELMMKAFDKPVLNFRGGKLTAVK